MYITTSHRTVCELCGGNQFGEIQCFEFFIWDLFTLCNKYEENGRVSFNACVVWRKNAGLIIEALHVTYDNVNMVDCSNAFKRSMNTTPTIPFGSLIIKSLLYRLITTFIEWTTQHLFTVGKGTLVQIFCVEAIDKFMQGFYTRVVSLSPATANVLLTWANHYHFTLLASLTRATFGSCLGGMSQSKCW